MARSIKLEQVVRRMKRAQGKRSQKQYARELGISQQYLCHIYAGLKKPGPMVIKALGLRHEDRYFDQP